MIEALDNLRATLIEFEGAYDPAYPQSANLADDLVADTKRACETLIAVACAIRAFNVH